MNANSRYHTTSPQQEKAYENHYIARGRIFPVKAGERVRARCGECGLIFVMPETAHEIHDALYAAKWWYTLMNGWVCPDCRPLPRLQQGEANRAPNGGTR